MLGSCFTFSACDQSVDETRSVDRTKTICMIANCNPLHARPNVGNRARFVCKPVFTSKEQHGKSTRGVQEAVQSQAGNGQDHVKRQAPVRSLHAKKLTTSAAKTSITQLSSGFRFFFCPVERRLTEKTAICWSVDDVNATVLLNLSLNYCPTNVPQNSRSWCRVPVKSSSAIKDATISHEMEQLGCLTGWLEGMQLEKRVAGMRTRKF